MIRECIARGALALDDDDWRYEVVDDDDGSDASSVTRHKDLLTVPF